MRRPKTLDAASRRIRRRSLHLDAFPRHLRREDGQEPRTEGIEVEPETEPVMHVAQRVISEGGVTTGSIFASSATRKDISKMSVGADPGVARHPERHLDRLPGLLRLNPELLDNHHRPGLDRLHLSE